MTPSALHHAREIADGERFQFGSNWGRFLGLVDEDRIRQAEDSLRTMLSRKDLHGVSFLDIGSGSGLFSLAARRLGARVRSFDYDPKSVACTKRVAAPVLPGRRQLASGSGVHPRPRLRARAWDVRCRVFLGSLAPHGAHVECTRTRPAGGGAEWLLVHSHLQRYGGADDALASAEADLRAAAGSRCGLRLPLLSPSAGDQIGGLGDAPWHNQRSTSRAGRATAPTAA